MGTPKDWMFLAFAAIIWGGGTLLLETRRRRDARNKTVALLADVLRGAFMGLLFGLLMRFGWKAFHWPLVLFTGGTFLGAALGVFWARRYFRSAA